MLYSGKLAVVLYVLSCFRNSVFVAAGFSQPCVLFARPCFRSIVAVAVIVVVVVVAMTMTCSNFQLETAFCMLALQFVMFQSRKI